MLKQKWSDQKADRRWVSRGVRTPWEERENFFPYSFHVRELVSKAAHDVAIGKMVAVYDDDQNPPSNALEDFRDPSFDTERFLEIFVLLLAASLSNLVRAALLEEAR